MFLNLDNFISLSDINNEELVILLVVRLSFPSSVHISEINK
jgi:hypothetical protein